MEDLKVTLVQTKIFWEKKDRNLKHLTDLLKPLKKGRTDLIILPEMFTTGFSMNTIKLAEETNGPGMEWMRHTARTKNAVVTGSLIIKEGKDFYNRLIWMQPDGTYQFYNKRHLFRMAHEQEHYTAGREKLIVEYKDWRICPMICYDLRFPVWCRNTPAQRYDLLLFVANWPVMRIEAWKQLLIARAIENQCYVAGVNRIGSDGNRIRYNGHSAIIDPEGRKITRNRPTSPFTETVTLSSRLLEKTRNTLPFLNDADDFEIIL